MLPTTQEYVQTGQLISFQQKVTYFDVSSC